MSMTRCVGVADVRASDRVALKADRNSWSRCRRGVRPGASTFLLCLVAATASFTLAAEPATGPANAEPRPGTLTYRNEQHWVLQEVIRDIAELVAFAQSKRSGSSPEVRLEIAKDPPDTFNVMAASAGKRVERRFELKHHLWSPEMYAPVATAFLEAWAADLPRAASAPDTSLLTALAAGDVATIVRQSRRVSESLTKRPLDAELHENAALIAGSFAMREAAGLFRDQRPALSRMATHLALARALRPDEGECGKLARIIGLSLVVRQREALAGIDSIAPSNSGWATALKLRTTGDWRLLSAPEKASRLEQLELFRALKRASASTKAMELLRSINAPATAEWSRFARERHLSVEEGHAVVAESVALELQSLAAAYEAFYGTALSEPEVAALLNVATERSVAQPSKGARAIEVLSWGHLAAFHQRHICHSVLNTNRFLRNKLSAKDTAAAFDREVAPFVSDLTLFPIVKQSLATRGTGKGATLQEAKALILSHPQLLTAAAWTSMPDAHATAAMWFHPELPFGTSYDLWPRYTSFAGESLLRKGRAFWIDAATMAPYDLPVSRVAMAARFGREPSIDQIAESFAATKDFVIDIMAEIAERVEADPPRYRKIMEEIAAIEPNYFIDLGIYLAGKGMRNEAAQAYQRAFEHATDRVYLANNSNWFVDYYLQLGRLEEAEKIARAAAEAYSSRGLATMAKLLERTNRIEESEEYYKRIKERYDDPADLDAFYLRNRDRKPEYRRAADERIAALFPAGFEKVQLRDFADPPRDGVVIQSSSDFVGAAQMKPGDVIVAIDGVRVRSLEQYEYARDRTFDSKMTLIVWTGAQYAELPVDVPGRRMNCKIATFTGP